VQNKTFGVAAANVDVVDTGDYNGDVLWQHDNRSVAMWENERHADRLECEHRLGQQRLARGLTTREDALSLKAPYPCLLSEMYWPSRIHKGVATPSQKGSDRHDQLHRQQ
jgi:hypothetical protein